MAPKKTLQQQLDEIRATGQAVYMTRACPDCGRPQHYTGIENGWCHDVLVDMWNCADPAKARA